LYRILLGAHKDESGTISVDNYEAFLLTQWLEKGVFSALELSYLSALTFAVYSKHPIMRLFKDGHRLGLVNNRRKTNEQI